MLTAPEPMVGLYAAVPPTQNRFMYSPNCSGDWELA